MGWLQRLGEKAKSLEDWWMIIRVHLPLLPALFEDRFAFSDVQGWHVAGDCTEAVRKEVAALLDEELLPFVKESCVKAPRPYGTNEFLVSLIVAQGEETLAHRELKVDLMKLDEGLEQVRRFFLERCTGHCSSARKSMPDSRIRL